MTDMTPQKLRLKRGRRGFSLMELLIVVAIIMILAAIAVPSYNKVQMGGHETAAARVMETLRVAQQQYFGTFGRFATTLVELGPPAGGTDGPAGAGLIPGDLAKGTVSGYVFTMQGTETGYMIQAQPSTFGGTGRRTFYTDQTGVTRQNWGKDPATSQSPELK